MLYLISESSESLFGISQSEKTSDSMDVVQTVSKAWDSHNLDDIRFCFLVIINAYIRPVPILKNLRSKGFSTLNCMKNNCLELAAKDRSQLLINFPASTSYSTEPVFQVKTLEGKVVWRRRKYRIERSKILGTFYFSVLDNGVISNEFWTIVNVSNDFSWGLFHYSRTVLFSPEKESRRLVSGEATKILADWRVKDSCQDVICY
ncbi:hypothetical protein POTOM_028429 [Populus tomentosa]|uniref:Uncharacterized protein n=1 Tax=Populus tomentosa TaxID=118781 RepID=A0A8X7ZDC9_POPTO|nr:hypothetical protein POTOM_028429 [Populus tomentosa]